MAISPERRAEARRQDRIIRKAVPALRSAVAREKNIYIRQCAEAYRNAKHFRFEDFAAHDRRLRGILEKYYLRIGRVMNGEITNQIKAQKPSLEIKASNRFEYFLTKWAREEAARKAKPIAGTTQADINRAVQKAYVAKEPESGVISDIMATRGYSNFRADAIARTETHNAAMYASLVTVDEFSTQEGVVMKKIWSPTVDDRSRPEHVDMESYPAIGMDEMFQVANPKGGTNSMDRPGDPSAPAEQVINCRCVLTYEAQ